MIYRANFNTNNGTRYMEAIKSTNKFELNKRIRGAALGNRFQGNQARWTVIDCNDRIVFEGHYFPGTGIRYYVYNYKSVF